MTKLIDAMDDLNSGLELVMVATLAVNGLSRRADAPPEVLINAIDQVLVSAEETLKAAKDKLEELQAHQPKA